MSHDFVHIHNHSYFSALDGLSSPKDLAKTAKDLGFPAIALTDHGNCSGLYHFQKACKDVDIKPILGTESYITEDHTVKEKGSQNYHLVLLAKNKVGYKNLMYLSSYGYTEGFYYRPRIDFDILKDHSEGLICTSACPIGQIPYMLENDNQSKAVELAGQYKDLFGDDFYIEIMTHKYFNNDPQELREKKVAKLLYQLSKKMDIKAICTNDTHYARKEQAEAHDVLLSIQTLDNVKNPKRFSFNSDEFYLKSYEEMMKVYGQAPELLLNTMEISEKIEWDIINPSDDLLPNFDLPEGFADEEAYLKALVTDGMKEKGLINKPEYRERIRYEMSVITKCNYTKYFLILWDIINYARTEGIRVGIGRGSAASSLCLYVLGVIKLDPMKYDLIFERFLNPDRISPPDVDIDFDYYRRDEVFNYIIRKYGSDHCCQIGTYNTFKARNTIRSIVKALDLGGDWEIYQKKKQQTPDARIEMTKKSLDLADTISNQVPMKAGNIEEAVKSSSDLRQSMGRYPKLRECAKHIEGVVSSGGVHPAGILVCKNPVIETVPLRTSRGVVCSQFDGPEVEEIGMLKFDLLALKTLTIVDRTVKMVKDRHGVDLDVDALDPNDPNVFKILNGEDPVRDTKGIFQFEADGISKLLANIHVDDFEDMIVANALYRPGPLGAGVHDMYCNYKHGREEIQYLHPKMGETLKKTYGIMVFQENIMRVAQELAGFTGGQADTLRKAVGKKKADLLKQQKDLFVKGCGENGIDAETADKIFTQIDYFAGYGFNKSHSAAYAFLAYQTAYLKYYYPIEFMCNLLSGEINNNDKDESLRLYINQAKRMGIICMPEHINKSGVDYQIEKGMHKQRQSEIEFLRKPLTGLKGIGAKAVKSIVEHQPYKSLEDFISKIDARVVNIRVFNTLVDSGCMDEAWGNSREELKKIYPEIKKKADKKRKAREKKEKEDKEYGGGSLFDFTGANLEI